MPENLQLAINQHFQLNIFRHKINADKSSKPLTHQGVLVEQLRLLMVTTSSSVIPIMLLACLLLWTLSNPQNAMALKIWAAMVISSKLMCAWHAKKTLNTLDMHTKPQWIVWRLMGLYTIDAFAWGVLVWVTLDTASIGGSILSIATVAAVTGGAIATLAAVLPVCLVFCSVAFIVMAIKLMQMGDPAYDALTIAGVLYIATLIGQARNISRAILAAIHLRFENIELIAQLKIETQHAELATQKAERANLAKSKFLAAASHDLRQPTHAQGLFLAALASSGLSEPQRKILNKASDAAEAGAEMLNTLLDFSRIEASVVTPNVINVHLQTLLFNIESELAPQADAKRLIYRSRETTLAVKSDPILLALILRNLVSNAIRYTHHGGVLVGCRKRGDNVVIEVWDTGIGIAVAQQDEIFLEFHQLGNPERQRQKGLGLGLAIAKGYACALRHQLNVFSKVGRGSVFKLTLPIAFDVTTHDNNVRIPVMNEPLNMRLLIIDDDLAVREAMQTLLETWGCQVQAADAIDEAVMLARITTPAMIISDYRLRNNDTGAQAIAAIRAYCGHLPALLITGDTAPERLRDAIGTGIPLLHKPVAPEQLYNAILKAVSI